MKIPSNVYNTLYARHAAPIHTELNFLVFTKRN